MNFKLTDWPRHNCVPDLPPVGDFTEGTLIECGRPWLRNGQMYPVCSRQWIVSRRRGWFRAGNLEWKESEPWM